MRKALAIALAAAGLAWGTTAPAAEPLAPGASRHETEIGVNVLQSSYSRNWNGGDKGSVNWSVGLNSRHEKQVGERFNWRNTLKLAYGQNHQRDPQAEVSFAFHAETPPGLTAGGGAAGLAARYEIPLDHSQQLPTDGQPEADELGAETPARGAAKGFADPLQALHAGRVAG